MDNLSIELSIKPEDLLNTLNNKLIECSHSIFFGMNAIEQTIEIPETLNNDDNEFYYHRPLNESLNLQERKLIFKKWLLRKGFEDILNAINETLISFSNIIDLNEKIKNKNNKMSLEEMQKIIFEPDFKNTKIHFPLLLKKVSENLVGSLGYTEQINSINKVRNCIVHRNGLVTNHDTNEDDCLVLKWIYVELEIEDNGLIKKLEQSDIITSETKFNAKELKKEKKFSVNENIEITFQEFNELIFFCQYFGNHLLGLFQLKN